MGFGVGRVTLASASSAPSSSSTGASVLPVLDFLATVGSGSWFVAFLFTEDIPFDNVGSFDDGPLGFIFLTVHTSSSSSLTSSFFLFTPSATVACFAFPNLSFCFPDDGKSPLNWLLGFGPSTVDTSGPFCDPIPWEVIRETDPDAMSALGPFVLLPMGVKDSGALGGGRDNVSGSGANDGMILNTLE